MLNEGGQAPDFDVLDGENKKHKLTNELTVLYFYPKDNTPGCTIEACELTGDFSGFKGINLLGARRDSIESHKKFAEKFKIPYPLLSDPDHKLAEAYGAWGEKEFMGKKYMGIIRSTFIIKNKKIIKVFSKVTAKGHSKE